MLTATTVSESPALWTFARVVELSWDPYDVHLVVEVSRKGFASEVTAYRAATTICGQDGYRETTRERNACPECLRAMPEAIESATAEAAALLDDAELGRPPERWS